MIKIKEIDGKGDYYFCSKCSNWHEYTKEKGKLGNKHIHYFDYEQSNAEDAKYYYCSYHRRWHNKKRGCIQYRAKLVLSKSTIVEADRKKAKEKEKLSQPSRKPGHYTAMLGKNLVTWNNQNRDCIYQIFYDHSKHKSSEIGKSIPFIGDHIAGHNKLANVDIMVVNPKTNSVRLLVEVEESKAPPKIIIGDIFNIIMADNIRFNKKDYHFHKTDILLIINVHERNIQIEKAKIVLNEIKTIKEILEKKGYKRNLNNIEIICANEKWEIPEIGLKKILSILS